MRCKHDFVRSGHGDDLICTKCGYAAMQRQMDMPMQATLIQPLTPPMLRETIEFPFWNGEKTVQISVDKENLLREMRKEVGLLNRLGC